MRIDPITGDLWIKVEGLEVSAYHALGFFHIGVIVKRDSAGGEDNQISLLSFDGSGCYYQVFHQQVIPPEFNSLRSLVGWVRFAVNDGKGFKYL